MLERTGDIRDASSAHGDSAIADPFKSPERASRRTANSFSKGNSSMAPAASCNILLERLQHILVWEISLQGSTEFRYMTLRELYAYVQMRVKTRPTEAPPTQCAEPPSPSEQPPPPPARPAGDGPRRAPVSRSAAHAPPGAGASHVTYRELLGGYLHPRDMRRMVTPFSQTNVPEVVVRRHVMLLNFDPLRAVALRDRLLVLVPDGSDSLLHQLEKRIRGGITELENHVFGKSGSPNISGGLSERNSRHNSGEHTKFPSTQTSDQSTAPDDDELDGDSLHDEWEDMGMMNWMDMPFELVILDSVLQCVTALLAQEAAHVTHRAEDAMRDLRGEQGRHRKRGPAPPARERLRTLKDEVKTVEARVHGFIRSLGAVLDEDEDMALMNLSRLVTHPELFVQPASPHFLAEESDEPELILEAHSQAAITTLNELSLLQGKIVTTEEAVAMKMDTIRNRLLFINMLLTMIGLVVSVASLVGSFFGMNVPIPVSYSESPDAFRNILATTLGVTLGTLVTALFIFSWLEVFSGVV